LRPEKSPALDSLRKKTQTIARPPKKFNQIAAPPTKHEDMTGEWIFLKGGLHHPAQPGETFSQIGEARGDPDARSCR
jgi:hypothetical protein